MRLSVTIMAHPSRAHFVDGLAEQLPMAEIVWDQQNDRWHTGSRALLANDPAADFHLVVQDDVILGRDLVAGATAAAAATDGERPIALYTGKVKPSRRIVTPAVKKARAAGSPWIAMWGPWWGPGIILPTAHIRDLVKWGNDHPEIENYDRRIARWYERQQIRCWYTVPSLVDHRPVDENPSLIEGRTASRQAHYFIGERSALEIDWSTPPIDVPTEQVFRNERLDKIVEAKVGSGKHRNLTLHPEWTLLEEAAA